MVKSVDCDIFITIHYKDNDKIYTYANDEKFTIDRVSDLILRDMSTGAFLNKNKKFEDVDFDKVKRNIKNMSNMDSNAQSIPRNQPFKSVDPSEESALKFTSLTPSELEEVTFSQ